MLSYEVIIVGTHRVRRQINAQYRRLLGIDSGLPIAGERLVYLRNRHSNGLLNGSIWNVRAIEAERGGFPPMPIADGLGAEVEVEGRIDLVTTDEIDAGDYAGDSFTFGYAITCHKAQGSQWKSILVFDESPAFGDDRDRWLYTAITRATDPVTVVRSW